MKGGSNRITYEAKHLTCTKYVVYFTSRYGVIYTPHDNRQRFYQGHHQKICCIAKHPFRQIVATGEVANEPTIHIWNAITLETLIVLKTSHENGVLHISFSKDGEYIVSVGIDKAFSL